MLIDAVFDSLLGEQFTRRYTRMYRSLGRISWSIFDRSVILLNELIPIDRLVQENPVLLQGKVNANTHADLLRREYTQLCDGS